MKQEYITSRDVLDNGNDFKGLEIMFSQLSKPSRALDNYSKTSGLWATCGSSLRHNVAAIHLVQIFRLLT